MPEGYPKARIYHIRLGEGVVRNLSDVPKLYAEIEAAGAELPANVFPIIDLLPDPDPPDLAA